MQDDIEAHWSPQPANPALAAGQTDIWWIDLADERAADRRRTAHAALRTIIGLYLRTAPGALEIARHEGGKPYLASPASPLAFNLSHSREVALLAVSAAGEVGVDIEIVREIRNLERLARRALPTAECEALQAVPAARRNSAFLRYWTLMEARQKAAGRGIFAAPVDPAAVRCVSFEPAPGTIAALALSPPHDPALRFFRFSPP